MYFYDFDIATRDSSDTPDAKIYTASMKGKTICPKCGREMERLFTSKITNKDIQELALRLE
jgi:hypothetical protein